MCACLCLCQKIVVSILAAKRADVLHDHGMHRVQHLSVHYTAMLFIQQATTYKPVSVSMFRQQVVWHRPVFLSRGRDSASASAFAAADVGGSMPTAVPGLPTQHPTSSVVCCLLQCDLSNRLSKFIRERHQRILSMKSSIIMSNKHGYLHQHTHSRLTAFFPGLHG